jgi:Putative zinc-finger
MTSMTGPACREIRQLLGVYVVGAIDPAERAYVDAHLAECGACREELGGLAGLPALLGRVPVAEVEQMSQVGAGGRAVPDMAEPPAELLNSLLRRVSARQRNRKWRSVLALAAAVAIAAGGTAAVYDAHQPAGHGQTSTAQDVVRASNAHLASEVRYSATPWGGTAMKIAVKGLPPLTVCQFWVRNAAGKWSVAGTWTSGPGDGEYWYSVSSSVDAASVREFQITSGGKVLLNIPAT